MNAIRQFGPLVSRILISVLFIFSGVGKVMNFDQTAMSLAFAWLPDSSVLVSLIIIIELGGALMLLFGYRTRTAAALLIAFTFLATVFFHMDFTDQTQTAMFLKNLAIIGGLVHILVHGAWPISIDYGRLYETTPPPKL